MDDAGNYWLMRLLFYRALGLVYLLAFVCALNQFRPLLGERGLLPVPAYVNQIPFRQTPSLFYLWPTDWAFTTAAWIGTLLSCVVIAGFADRYSSWLSAAVWAALWLLYLSFVNVGQTFYAFGWESILLEAGFFAMFLGVRNVAPPMITIWVLRWLLFRVMFGAGLIKLRGDPCWHDLSCLNYHYETQPMPNPLSWYFHTAPAWTHRAGVAFNHFAELIVPFGYFTAQPFSSIAGILTIVFQALIMASGNLSWLNFLTIVLAIPTLDGRLLERILPLKTPLLSAPQPVFKSLVVSLGIVVALLSINPIRNMISSRQAMNFSYNPFHLVGTYGAFGGITRTRFEIVVEGTEESVLTANTRWRAYEFKGKPGDPNRTPPQIAPYHLRLDWLMWFAAMSQYYQHPWFVHFIGKLLQGDKAVLGLLRSTPFPDRPPRFVRAEMYEYHFTSPEERKKTGEWWKRRYVGSYFPPVSLQTPAFRSLLERQGWL